jgi:hypothetical protein
LGRRWLMRPAWREGPAGAGRYQGNGAFTPVRVWAKVPLPIKPGACRLRAQGADGWVPQLTGAMVRHWVGSRRCNGNITSVPGGFGLVRGRWGGAGKANDPRGRRR